MCSLSPETRNCFQAARYNLWHFTSTTTMPCLFSDNGQTWVVFCGGWWHKCATERAPPCQSAAHYLSRVSVSPWLLIYHPFSHILLCCSASSGGWGLLQYHVYPKTNSREGAGLLWIASGLGSQFSKHTGAPLQGCLVLPLCGWTTLLQQAECLT